MPELRRPSDQKILDDVQEYGWHVVNVLPEAGLPGFTYTVGLYRTFEHPEVLVYGLRSSSAHKILNALGSDIRNRHRFIVGHTYDDILDSLDCTFRTILPGHYADHLGNATWFYDGEGFPAIQLVYPDQHGRWPWHAEAASQFRHQQPILADLDPLPPDEEDPEGV